MTNEMQQYIDTTTKVSEQLSILIISEREKRKALLNRDKDKIERALQVQQPQAMQLESLEKKRFALQTSLGFADLTSEELLTKISREEHALLSPIIKDLRKQVQELRSLNKVAFDIASAELRIIERGKEYVAVKSGRGLYGASGQKDTGRTAGLAFTEKI